MKPKVTYQTAREKLFYKWLRIHYPGLELTEGQKKIVSTFFGLPTGTGKTTIVKLLSEFEKDEYGAWADRGNQK